MRISADRVTHGGKLAEAAEGAGKGEDEILDFSASVNPLDSLDIRESIFRAYDRINRYPDDRYERLYLAASEFYGVSHENIIVGNGSTEVLRLFCEAFIEPDDLVIIPKPTYGEYEVNCRIFGAKTEFLDYSSIRDKDPDIEEEIRRASFIFLCNPNNPTGDLISRDDMIVTDRDLQEI